MSARGRPSTLHIHVAAAVEYIRAEAVAGRMAPTNVEIVRRLGCSSTSVAVKAVQAAEDLGLLVVRYVGRYRVIAAPDGSWQTAEPPRGPEPRPARKPKAAPRFVGQRHSEEARARISGAAKEMWARRRGFEVPAWVERAGLREEFVDVARLRGEEDAAAHCRALKRGMAA
jgi:hypothetical protein